MLRRFFKNAGIMAFTEVMLRLKGFIFMPLLTRHFGPMNYGVWSQVSVIVSIFSPLLVLGSDSAMLRYVPGRSRKEQIAWFTAWNLFLLATSIPLCLILLMLNKPLSALFFGRGNDYLLFIPIAVGTLFLNIYLNTARNWFRIQNDAVAFSAISISQAIAGVAALLAVIFLKKGAYELVLYTLIGDLLTVTGLFVKIVISYGLEKPDFSIIPSLLRFGLPLVPIAYAMWGLNSLDRILLVKYATLGDVGIYSLAYYLGYLVIQVLVNPLWNLYPSSATELYNKNDKAGLQSLFEHVSGTILTLTVPAIVGLLVTGRHIITTFATPDFLPGASLIALITASYLFLMLASFFETALGWIHKQHFVTLSMIFAFLLNVLLSLLLIPRYSITGAAWATFFAFFSHLIITFMLSRHYRLLKVSITFTLTICALSGIMGVCVFGLSCLLPQYEVVQLLIIPLAGIIIYGVLLLTFNVLSLQFVKKLPGFLFPERESAAQ